MCSQIFQFRGKNTDFWSFFVQKSHFFQLLPFTNTTSATFCNFCLHTHLVDILSPEMKAKIPCYYVLQFFFWENIEFWSYYDPKSHFYQPFTFHKYHICNFMQLFSSQPVSRHIRSQNVSKNSLLLCGHSYFFGKIQIFVHFLTKNNFFFNFDLPQIPHLQLSATFVCAPCQRTCSALKLPQDFLLLSALLRTFTNLCFSFFSLHVLGKNLTISNEKKLYFVQKRADKKYIFCLFNG